MVRAGRRNHVHHRTGGNAIRSVINIVLDFEFLHHLGSEVKRKPSVVERSVKHSVNQDQIAGRGAAHRAEAGLVKARTITIGRSQ